MTDRVELVRKLRALVAGDDDVPILDTISEAADYIEALNSTEGPTDAALHLADEMDGLIPYLANHSWRVDRLVDAVRAVRDASKANTEGVVLQSGDGAGR